MTPDSKKFTGRRPNVSDEQPAVVPKKEKRSSRRWFVIILGLTLAFVAYAFGVQATDVDLSQIKDETRREQLFRILRALAHPDLVQFDTEEVLVTFDLFVPCSGDASENGAVEPYIVVTPPCGNPGDVVTVEGYGFIKKILDLHSLKMRPEPVSIEPKLRLVIR